MMLKSLILPVAMIAILASMLIPLPAVVLDFLLIANLILALILLVTSLYIDDPLKLSSLPTILLIATLYRLAINISSTRSILSNGDAGKTIEAFGKIVVQGNITVGIVIFLIITLVQFLVIAKGSERVAEVSARFSLDALPGKQMSIDADVRAGLIDFESARKKREELQTESRFYGALDGAMKFVKGDAIAGIIICAINLIGGLMIGLFVHELDLAQAISKYSILSVGDGLVSQVPALLNSMAAGLVVTRVARNDGNSLAIELVDQLSQVQPAKWTIGIACLMFSFIPSVPTLPCLIFGCLLIISAKLMENKSASSLQSNIVLKSFNPKIPPLIQIEISKSVAQVLSGVTSVVGQIDGFRQEVFDKHGLIFSAPLIAELPHERKAYAIRFRGIQEKINLIKDDIDLNPSEIVDAILRDLMFILESRVTECIDDVMTHRILDFLDKEAPELVSAVVPGIVSVTQLSNMLRSLVAEGLPIKNFDMILQAVAETGSRAMDEGYLLEEVRVALKRVITRRFSEQSGVIRAYTIDPILDLSFAQSEKAGQPFDLDNIHFLVAKLNQLKTDNAVLVTSKASRRGIHACLLSRGVNLPVLAFEELTNEVSVEWLDRIMLSETKDQEKQIARLAA